MMNTFGNKLAILIILFLTLVKTPYTQETLPFELVCEVNRVYPSLSVTKEELKNALFLNDINPHYKNSWVRTYNSVKISCVINGQKQSAFSKSNVLNQEQRKLMSNSDYGSEILVEIEYIPENTLKLNEEKQYDFIFTIEPENDAVFNEEVLTLNQYLQTNILDRISTNIFKQHQLTAVKFTVNEEGQVINANVFQTSDDESTDKLLLNAICNMPVWKPAHYANGKKLSQDFVLTIGDMQSCIVNLLNIRKSLAID